MIAGVTVDFRPNRSDSIECTCKVLKKWFVTLLKCVNNINNNITHKHSGNWGESTISVGDMMRCHVLTSRLEGGDSMECAEKMQKLFTSIESLQERATSITVKVIRNKIKTEFDKYIGRGRNKRVQFDDKQLSKGNEWF